MWRDNPDLRVCASPNPFEGDEWAKYWREHLEGTPEVPATPIVRPVEPRTRTVYVQYAKVTRNLVMQHLREQEGGKPEIMLRVGKALVPATARLVEQGDGRSRYGLCPDDPTFRRATFQDGPDTYMVTTWGEEEEREV